MASNRLLWMDHHSQVEWASASGDILLKGGVKRYIYIFYNIFSIFLHSRLIVKI